MNFATNDENYIMRKLLLMLILACPFFGFSQFFAGSASYLYDAPDTYPWSSNHGIQIGMGLENQPLAAAPLTLSFRYSGVFNLGRPGNRIENVEFDLPDSIENNMGFADVKFKKFNLGLEFDIGYQIWEYAVIEPYANIGGRLSNNTSWVEYELYDPDPCFCTTSTPEEVSESISLGFTSGLGFKIHATESFFFDFRASYYGTWGLKRNEHFGAPDPESFHIDTYGTPTFDYGNQNYFDGFEFRVGIIFNMNTGGSSDNSWYYNSSGDSDDDDSSSESESGSSGSSSGSTCTPVTLSPKGRGDK